MSEENENQTAGEGNAAASDGWVEGSSFAIRKLYVKDMSFESPNTPGVFAAEWKPEVQFTMSSEATQLEEDVWEVVLTPTVTVKMNGETAYLIEVQQAGIFSMSGIPEENLPWMHGSYCANILFPFAREAIANIVNRGGFPPLFLAPVNFDHMFAQQVEQQKAAIAEAAAAEKAAQGAGEE